MTYLTQLGKITVMKSHVKKSSTITVVMVILSLCNITLYLLTVLAVLFFQIPTFNKSVLQI